MRSTNLDGDVALRDLPHVETNCGDHVFAELAGLKDTHTHTAGHVHNSQIDSGKTVGNNNNNDI